MRGGINGITLSHNLPTSKWANSSMFMFYVLSCFAVADGQVTFPALMSYMTLGGPASSSSGGPSVHNLAGVPHCLRDTRSAPTHARICVCQPAPPE